MKFFRQRLVCALALSTLLILQACGSSGEPFSMNVRSDIIVGDAGPDGFSFLVDPVLQQALGEVGADIAEEFNDRFELDLFNLEAVASFPDLGEVRLVLDPNFPATATVYKLNRNNQLFGTHMVRLSLIIETPEQNLTLTHLTLSGDSAALKLDQDLPPLTFFFQGQAMELDLSALQLQVPASLIVSDSDRQ